MANATKPQVGRSVGHERAVFMATSGHFCWPPMGSSDWPLTRKYGLWLLMSTQCPSKLHPSALSQCDNLGLTKMNSPIDLAEIGRVFGYVPDELLRKASSFSQ
jgi:hypothetical protein